MVNLKVLLFFLLAVLNPPFLRSNGQSPRCDIDLLRFALNLEYLEAEFFLFGALGHGLDAVAPELSARGPPPIGARRATLHWFVRDIIIQFAFQEVGHLRAIRRAVGGFPRPQMDLSVTHFSRLMNMVIGAPLEPPFDPYVNDVNFLLASYILPYIGLTSYIGSNPFLNTTAAKRLLAGVLAVEAGQDSIIRSMLYERALQHVHPYSFNVAEATERISRLRNQLSRSTIDKDDGVISQLRMQNHRFSHGNIINGDENSVAFSRTPQEILRIVYETGSESIPGGFFPVGANGTIAHFYLNRDPNTTLSCPFPPV